MHHSADVILMPCSIYPLLSRLQHHGYIEGYLVASRDGPKRKYYVSCQPEPNNWSNGEIRCGRKRGLQTTHEHVKEESGSCEKSEPSVKMR